MAQEQGKRTVQPSGPSKLALVLGGMLAGIAAIYLAFCGWVQLSDKILPNVYVAGTELSDMTQEEAKQALDQALAPSAFSNPQQVVQLQCKSFTGYLSADAFAVDTAASAQQAMQVGRGNFLTSGFQYISSLLGTQTDLNPEAVSLSQSGEDALEELFRQANEELNPSLNANDYTMDLDAGTLTMTKDYTHTYVDEAATLAQAQDAFARVLRGESASVTMTVSEQPAKQPNFDTIRETIYAEVQEPLYDTKTGQISDHVVGVDFDIAQAETIFNQTAEGSTYEIPLTVTQPKDTKETYQSKLFAHKLGTSTSTLANGSNRSTNVSIAADAFNGMVLMPGEEFSFNATASVQSYLSAPVYVGGRTEYESGGGICQVSSTIYHALLHTTLEIVERHYHQYAVGYVPDGMDATVYFGGKNFRFKNNTEYPVKIVTNWYDKGSVRYLTATLYGTNESGRYAVPSNETYDWVSPTTSYVAKDSVPQGTTVVETQQNPYTGRKALTYRTIFEADGTRVTTEKLGVSNYAMRPKTIYYNPLDGDPATWVDGVPPQPVTDTPSEPAVTPPTTEPTVPPTETPPVEENPAPPVETPPVEAPSTPSETPPAVEQTPPASEQPESAPDAPAQTESDLTAPVQE